MNTRLATYRDALGLDPTLDLSQHRLDVGAADPGQAAAGPNHVAQRLEQREEFGADPPGSVVEELVEMIGKDVPTQLVGPVYGKGGGESGTASPAAGEIVEPHPAGPPVVWPLAEVGLRRIAGRF
jgi:hypothetical protein